MQNKKTTRNEKIVEHFRKHVRQNAIGAKYGISGSRVRDILKTLLTPDEIRAIKKDRMLEAIAKRSEKYAKQRKTV